MLRKQKVDRQPDGQHPSISSSLTLYIDSRYAVRYPPERHPHRPTKYSHPMLFASKVIGEIRCTGPYGARFHSSIPHN